jgi:hypothetical protein
MPDPIIHRIESFPCRCGTLLAERRNKGYTLYRASTGTPVARLRPTGQDDRVEVLYRSPWKERWAKTPDRSDALSCRSTRRLRSLHPRISSGLRVN